MPPKVIKFFHRIRAYWKVWARLTALQFEQQVANAKGAAIIMIAGKLVRFVFAFIFIWVVVGQAKVLAGYNLAQAIFILALFNWGSTITQLFYRGVYQFHDKVRDGSFDFYLLSPLNELFYSLFSYTDPLDVITVIPYTVILFWAWHNTGFPITGLNLLSVLLTLIIMMVFVFAVHVFIIGIGVKYLEVDNTIMLYRDLERMAAYPIDVYGKFLGFTMTFVLPFAIIATIPAKLIFGLLHPLYLLIFLVIALVELKLSLSFWHNALKSYGSASS